MIYIPEDTPDFEIPEHISFKADFEKFEIEYESLEIEIKEREQEKQEPNVTVIERRGKKEGLF